MLLCAAGRQCGLSSRRRPCAHGAPQLWWEAYNRSALRTYNRLHAHKEDDRYCDTLPCGVAAANATPDTDRNSGLPHTAVEGALPPSTTGVRSTRSAWDVAVINRNAVAALISTDGR